MNVIETSQNVYNFWFKELKTEQWFKKDLELDNKIAEKFKPTYEAAIKSELFSWRDTPHGALAEIIVLDQFSRNMFRGAPASFASDTIALTLAQGAIRRRLDLELKAVEKSFLYMPFMHSESLVIHEQAVKLFDQPGLENNLDFEIRHKKIIERFGRYPHRNEILGRTSTAEEIEFLKEPGSSF
ncbi:MAG: DUF924 domain-containing protein [Bdellovibrionales bacterium]|nr:DUF924 domain-containing protein [Bdellovibrionales bacterium]